MEVGGRLDASTTLPVGKEAGGSYSRSGVRGVKKLVMTVMFANSTDDIWKSVPPSVFLAVYFFSLDYRAQGTRKYVPPITECEIVT